MPSWKAQTVWCERRGSSDAGAAVIEFLSIAVLLLVPLVYLVITLGRVQAASLAAHSGARAAARAVTLSESSDRGGRRAEVAAELALQDQGFVLDAGQLRVRCLAQPCLSPGAEVDVTLTVRVVLPGVPGFVDGVVPLAVTVTATQVEMVDRFRVADS